MSDSSENNSAPEQHKPKPSRWLRFTTWPWASLLLTLSLSVSMLALLLWFIFAHSPKPPPNRPAPVFAEITEIAGQSAIRIKIGSPLESKLSVAPVHKETVSAPLLNVTGSLIARLSPGKEPAEERWQFSSPNLLSAYTDWRNAAIDMDFAQGQAVKIRNLADARVKAQTQVVERRRKLVAIGTDSLKNLYAEEVTLRELELQTRKDIFEAENAIRRAENNRAALQRQLLQDGIDPLLIQHFSDGTAVVVADVPEAKINLIENGRSCQARFYGFPNQLFNGRISNLAPTVSKDQHTLRVLFELTDPQNHLRPGMFADIGLSTDPRQALFMPVYGLLHIGQAEYALLNSGTGIWQVREVNVGELHGDEIEVLSGLHDGDKVAGNGAILLKPLAAKIIQAEHKEALQTTTVNSGVSP